jgi:DamX protein
VKTPVNAQIDTPDSGYPLISRERTEKLELLNHLITNLARAVVVCGPEGIGKTRLIKSFQETTLESWIFCWIKSDNKLSLGKIQELLSETIGQNMPDLKVESLENVFDRMASWRMRIVLVIDDAGNLAPGLIEKIVSYTNSKPVLRVIFALTHSELYLKNGTDPVIEDCYQIEIPPLSEKQCGEFLEYLSTLPKPRIQFSAINESMVAALYRGSHGIPGNLLTQLPAADSPKKTDHSMTILTYAVIALIVVALGVQWWSSRQKTDSDKVAVANNKEQGNAKVQQALVKPQGVPVQVKQPESAPQPPSPVAQETPEPAGALNTIKSAEVRNDIIEGSISQVMVGQGLKHDDAELQSPNPVASGGENTVQPQANDALQITEQVTVPGRVQAETPVAPSQAVVEQGLKHGDAGLQLPKPVASGSENAVQPQVAGGVPHITEEATATTGQVDMPVAIEESGHWLMGQPVENYTLQIMALSNEQAIIEVLQRHQALGQSLRYLKTKTRAGKDRFVLLYGSFSSPGQAKSEGALLPRELQKIWLRKVGAVQGEMNMPAQTDTPE